MVFPAITLMAATITLLLEYTVLLDRFVPMLVVVIGLLPVAIWRYITFQCSGVPSFERRPNPWVYCQSCYSDPVLRKAFPVFSNSRKLTIVLVDIASRNLIVLSSKTKPVRVLVMTIFLSTSL